MNKTFWLRTQSQPDIENTDATVIWTIDNFMGRKERNGQGIVSPTFRVYHCHFGDIETEWQIQVYPRGDPNSQDGQVSVFLHGSIGPISKESVGVKVSIVDESLNRFAEKTLTHQANANKIRDDEDTCYGESNYFTRLDLEGDDQYDDRKMPGRTLTLAIKLCISTYDDDNVPDYAAANDKNKDDSLTKGYKEVGGHLGKLLDNKEFCDMEIDCGGKVFTCHKLIVSARSPVFRAMFDVKMEERETGKVSIEDMKPEIMEEMLHFIYTGVVKESLPVENTMELLAAADKYQLDVLKDICLDKLFSVLDAGNAIELLILGEMYRIPKIKDAALMEVVHNMPEIADTEDYQRLEDYPKILLEIPKAMFK